MPCCTIEKPISKGIKHILTNTQQQDSIDENYLMENVFHLRIIKKINFY